VAKRRGRSFTRAELDAAEVVLAELLAAIRRCTLGMEEPLVQAMHLTGALEIARHAPEERARALGFVAAEARMRLQAVQALWHELRAETCLDTEPRPRVA
jgi:hypothetical protein